MKTTKLSCAFRLRSPLSHIGEAISTNSYLSERKVVMPDGRVTEVFAYSGNAFRGQLRDFAAQQFLHTLDMKAKPKAFHLLFSGGSISGNQKVDIEHERAIRKNIPMISLFGGGIGTTMLRGKMAVGYAWAACTEVEDLIGEHPLAPKEITSYGELTEDASFTRFDDTKDDLLSEVIEGIVEPKKEKEVAQQMRFTSELLSAGSTLVSTIVLCDATDVEIGVFVSALRALHDQPYLGGQRSRGHGEMAFEMCTSEGLFVKGGSGVSFEMGDAAKAGLEAYNMWLGEADKLAIGTIMDSIQ